MTMLLSVVIMLVIAGLILWAIEQFPLDGTIKQLIRVIVVVVCVIYVLFLLVGLLGGSGLVFPTVRRQ